MAPRWVPVAIAALAGTSSSLGGAAGGREAPDRTSAREVEVRWVDGSGRALDSGRGSLGLYRPREPSEPASRAEDRFRIELRGAGGRPRVRVDLASVGPATGRTRDRLSVETLLPLGEPGAFASPWLVLVADMDDRVAPHLSRRSLLAALGDRIEARVRRGGGRSVAHAIGVGRPPGEDDPRSIRDLSLRVTVLRTRPGGPPVVGGSEDGARRVVERQLKVLNEVLAQCFVRVGAEDRAEIAVADPPGPCLLEVGGELGLPSAGGQVRLVVDGERRGPWTIGSGYTPTETARVLSRHLDGAGFFAEVTTNPRRPAAAMASADIVVRRAGGALAEIGPWPGEPLTTDPRQSLAIGSVRLEDGLDPYTSADIGIGTLEERTVMKALARRDPRTVEVFVVDRFAGGAKLAESFLRSSGSPFGDAVVVGARSFARTRQAYALAHEIGHLLLGDLGHPDDSGEAGTWLLMHSRASSAVDGPRRIPAEVCAAMRASSRDVLE